MKSNHRNCEAAFESRALAEAYRSYREKMEPYRQMTYQVQEVPVLDGTPEMNRIMLGFPEGS